MGTCVDGLLDRAGVDARDVDQVFLTGGSSFVPAVRKIFEDRFGKDSIRAGGELIWMRCACWSLTLPLSWTSANWSFAPTCALR
jgi:hypothetical protein